MSKKSKMSETISPDAELATRGLQRLAELEIDDALRVDWSRARADYDQAAEAVLSLTTLDERRRRHADDLERWEQQRVDAAARFEASEAREDFDQMSAATTEASRARFLLEQADAKREALEASAAAANASLATVLDRCIVAAFQEEDASRRAEEEKLAQQLVEATRTLQLAVQLAVAEEQKWKQRRKMAEVAARGAGVSIPERRSFVETVAMLFGAASLGQSVIVAFPVKGETSYANGRAHVPPVDVSVQDLVVRALDAEGDVLRQRRPIYASSRNHDGPADYRIEDVSGSLAFVDVTQETLEKRVRDAEVAAGARRAQETKDALLKQAANLHELTVKAARGRYSELLDRWFDEHAQGIEVDVATREAASAKRDDFLEQRGVGRLDYRSRDYRERYVAREAAANAAWDEAYRNAPRPGGGSSMREDTAIGLADLAWARVWKRAPLMIPEQRYRNTKPVAVGAQVA